MLLPVQLFALSVCVAPAVGSRPAAALLGRCVLPGCGLLLTPLFTKRLCATPLAEALVRPGRMAPGLTGYLTMDQARSLLPLEAGDDNVSCVLADRTHRCKTGCSALTLGPHVHSYTMRTPVNG